MASIPIRKRRTAEPVAAGEPSTEVVLTTGGEPPPPTDDIGVNRVSAWRVPVEERLHWLRSMLDDRTDPAPPGVLAAMEVSRRSAAARTNLATWYSGGHIERAWRFIHLAEASVLASSPDLPARLPTIRERVVAQLGEKDLRVKALRAIERGEPTAADRVTVAEALQAHFAISDNSHTAVRNLRNRLVLFGLLMLGLNLLLGALSSLYPNLLPLCVKDFCATGAASSTGGDVWLIQLLGALGGAIAVVILLLRTRPSVVAYALTPYQAIIKVMLGAVLAVVGLLIAGTGLLQDLVANRPALLVLALTLGYAQQVGTRFLDSFADTVVGKAQPKVGDG